MDVEPKIGVYNTPKWIVYFMENLIKMDNLGVPLFLETPIQWNVTRLLNVAQLFLLPWMAGNGFPKDSYVPVALTIRSEKRADRSWVVTSCYGSQAVAFLNKKHMC